VKWEKKTFGQRTNGQRTAGSVKKAKVRSGGWTEKLEKSTVLSMVLFCLYGIFYGLYGLWRPVML
jgi:hypothetical protein